MAAITVTFACGHRHSLAASGDPVAICPDCGESRVQHTRARAPRFVGVATGPYADYKPLEAVAVNVAPKGPLTLKEQS